MYIYPYGNPLGGFVLPESRHGGQQQKRSESPVSLRSIVAHTLDDANLDGGGLEDNGGHPVFAPEAPDEVTRIGIHAWQPDLGAETATTMMTTTGVHVEHAPPAPGLPHVHAGVFGRIGATVTMGFCVLALVAVAAAVLWRRASDRAWEAAGRAQMGYCLAPTNGAWGEDVSGEEAAPRVSRGEDGGKDGSCVVATCSASE
jgi:hypothetical protein